MEQMREKVHKLLEEISEIKVETKEQLEEFRLKYLAKKGIVTALFDDFKNVSTDQKKEIGQKLNQLKEVEHQLQSQLQIADALIEANKKLLLTGDAQITEYSIAVGNLITIKNAISQNSSNKLQIINEINYWSFND